MCVDDSFEPNNRFLFAPRVDSDVPIHGRLCPGDQDYYRVLAQEGDTITATLSFSHAEGDLGLWLRDDSICINQGPTCWIPPEPLATSYSSTDVETLTYTVPEGEGGFYSVGVGVTSEAVLWTIPDHEVDTAYQLMVSGFSGGGATCEDDEFEPNFTNDPPTPTTSGQVLRAQMCAGDVDNYEISVADGDSIRADLATSRATGSVTVALIDHTAFRRRGPPPDTYLRGPGRAWCWLVGRLRHPWNTTTRCDHPRGDHHDRALHPRRALLGRRLLSRPPGRRRVLHRPVRLGLPGLGAGRGPGSLHPGSPRRREGRRRQLDAGRHGSRHRVEQLHLGRQRRRNHQEGRRRRRHRDHGTRRRARRRPPGHVWSTRKVPRSACGRPPNTGARPR